MTLADTNHPTSEKKPVSGERRVCLVLGSGGLRPIATLPLLEFLAEEDIKIDSIIGCSGGAAIGALIACGYSLQKIKQIVRATLSTRLFRDFDIPTLASLAGLPGRSGGYGIGMMRPGGIIERCRRAFGDKWIEDLATPLRIQTTDLKTGQGVVLSSGDLATAVYASSALFPALPPALVDGQWLVDGAFHASLPVMEAVKTSKCPIIAIVFEDAAIDEETPGLVQQFTNLLSQASLEKDRLNNLFSLETHHHEIFFLRVRFTDPVNLWNIHRMEDILAVGERTPDLHRNDFKHFFASI